MVQRIVGICLLFVACAIVGCGTPKGAVEPDKPAPKPAGAPTTSNTAELTE